MVIGGVRKLLHEGGRLLNATTYTGNCNGTSSNARKDIPQERNTANLLSGKGKPMKPQIHCLSTRDEFCIRVQPNRSPNRRRDTILNPAEGERGENRRCYTKKKKKKKKKNNPSSGGKGGRNMDGTNPDESLGKHPKGREKKLPRPLFRR